VAVVTGPDVDVDQVVPDHRPSRLSGALATVVAAVAAVLAGSVSGPALAVGLLGVAHVAAGVTVDSAKSVGFGAVVCFGAAMFAGVAGGGEVAVVGATLGAVLAWDLGEQAINVGEQVGRDATTTSGEFGHAAASLAIGLTAAAGVIGVYRVATSGLSSTALVALSLAAVLLIVALRH
jgi:hypothetical protein